MHMTRGLFLAALLSACGPASAVSADVQARKSALEQRIAEIFRHVGNATSVARGEYSACFTTAAEPSLTMLSLVVGLPAEFVTALRANRALEADAYGYEYCEYSLRLDDSRDTAWSKVLAIEELLRQGKRNVVWMDADAYFVKTKPFASITQQFFDEGKDIVFTDDLQPGGDPVNSGVLAMRNTPWTVSFWQSIWKDFPESVDNCRWEQNAIRLYSFRNRDEFAAHTAVVPHHLMNNVGSYHGEFIAHVAGGHKKNKYQRILPRLKDANALMAKPAGPDRHLRAPSPARGESSLHSQRKLKKVAKLF